MCVYGSFNSIIHRSQRMEATFVSVSGERDELCSTCRRDVIQTPASPT